MYSSSTLSLSKGISFYAILFVVTFASIAININAQRKDHLTEKEADLVREAQALDLRMKVFVKAIDRRFLVLEGTSLTKKQLKRIEKDSERWGELPKSSKPKLLSDIEKILDEAINNIDDAASRESKSDIFPRGVHILADASKRFIPKLKTFYENAKTERETAVTNQAITYCNMIIEASAKVKKPEKKKKKKKKKKNS